MEAGYLLVSTRVGKFPVRSTEVTLYVSAPQLIYTHYTSSIIKYYRKLQSARQTIKRSQVKSSLPARCGIIYSTPQLVRLVGLLLGLYAKHPSLRSISTSKLENVGCRFYNKKNQKMFSFCYKRLLL